MFYVWYLWLESIVEFVRKLAYGKSFVHIHSYAEMAMHLTN